MRKPRDRSTTARLDGGRDRTFMNWLNQNQIEIAAVTAFGLSLLIARAVLACIYP